MITSLSTLASRRVRHSSADAGARIVEELSMHSLSASEIIEDDAVCDGTTASSTSALSWATIARQASTRFSTKMGIWRRLTFGLWSTSGSRIRRTKACLARITSTRYDDDDDSDDDHPSSIKLIHTKTEERRNPESPLLHTTTLPPNVRFCTHVMLLLLVVFFYHHHHHCCCCCCCCCCFYSYCSCYVVVFVHPQHLSSSSSSSSVLF